MRATPLIKPGQDTGTGDLDVQIEKTPRIQGSFGLDNQGNRYTGPYRVRASVAVDSPFMLGDQITAHALGSNDGLWYGGLGYSAPLGISGLRGHVDATQTRYELGREFASLDANGTAKVLGVGLSYPIVRSQRVNLTVDASVQHKLLRDRQDAAGIEQGKSSKTLPIALSFDVRDNWAGGGITYGGTYQEPKVLEDGGLWAIGGIRAGQLAIVSELVGDVNWPLAAHGTKVALYADSGIAIYDTQTPQPTLVREATLRGGGYTSHVLLGESSALCSLGEWGLQTLSY